MAEAGELLALRHVVREVRSAVDCAGEAAAALLLKAIDSIRSERQLMEQLDYNILFRWFVGPGMDDAVWSATTFTKNRDRLLDGDIARGFFEVSLSLRRDWQFVTNRLVCEITRLVRIFGQASSALISPVLTRVRSRRGEALD